MAAKKYLSLEEAAEQLSVPAEQLNKLRSEGKLRGFADRGTWKFKAEDIEEFGRSLEVSSSPDVPLLDDDLVPGADGESGQSLEIRLPGEYGEEDEAGLADEPTIVRGGPGDVAEKDPSLAIDSGVGDLRDSASGPIDLSDSHSDVRLISDESSVLIGGGMGSDSDVRLIADDSSAVRAGGDEDDDSDVSLSSDSGTGSDSGPRGASVLDDDQPTGGSDQDSQLTLGADSGIMLESPLDSGVGLEGDSGVLIGADSGISLADDSGIALVDDSDVNVDADSGIALADDSRTDADSGIALADDSDVSLRDADSGDASGAIPLDDVSGGEDGSSIILLGDDSGIALADADAADGASGIGDSGVADSGIALDFLNEEDDGPSPTASLAAAGGAAAGAAAAKARGGGATEADMDAVDADSYSLADDEEGGADTSVILFEDDDEDEFDAPAGGQNTSQFELEEDFDDFEDDGSASQESVVSAEILADDSDDELDVFEASDADFDDDFESGASRADFAPGAYARAPEAEFDPVTVSLLGVGTLLLLFVGVLAFDLVRSMWGVNEPSVFSRTILDSIGSSLY